MSMYVYMCNVYVNVTWGVGQKILQPEKRVKYLKLLKRKKFHQTLSSRSREVFKKFNPLFFFFSLHEFLKKR